MDPKGIPKWIQKGFQNGSKKDPQMGLGPCQRASRAGLMPLWIQSWDTPRRTVTLRQATKSEIPLLQALGIPLRLGILL